MVECALCGMEQHDTAVMTPEQLQIDHLRTIARNTQLIGYLLVGVLIRLFFL
ncbi:MAG: hypothetical protein JW395_4106 [Nitrospira sp.]|nr:hypothetical protein [Nitrospira sp.]